MGIFNGGSFPTSGGTTIISQDGDQTLTLVGSILTISGTNSSVDLSGFLDDTNTTNTSLVLGVDNVLTLTDSASNTVTADLSGLVLDTPTLQEVTDAGNSTTNKITYNVDGDYLQFNRADGVTDWGKISYEATGLQITGTINNNLILKTRGNGSGEGLKVVDSSNNIQLLVETTTGAIGIGTTSPSAKIDVAGQHLLKDNYDDTGAIFRRNGTYGSVIALGRQGLLDGVTLDYPAQNTLGFSTDGTERMRITDTGAVGINITSPSAKLHVNSGTSDIVAVFESDDGTALINLIDETGNVYLQNTQGKLILSADPNNVTGSSRIGFAVDGSERMRITDTGLVGINTSSPSYTLEVDGGTNNTIASFVSTDIGSYISFVDDTTTSGEYVQIGAVGNGLAIRTNNTTALTIDTSQNLGIGTSSPSAKLEVEGGAIFNTHIGNPSSPYINDDEFVKLISPNGVTGILTNADNGNTWLNTDGGTDLWLNWYSLNSPSLKTDLRVGDGNGGNAILSVIGSNQRVGINKTSPDAKLHIVGGAAGGGGNALLVENGDGDDLLKVEDNSDTTVFGEFKLAGYTSTFYDDTPNKFLGVDSSGNVVKQVRTWQSGIATTTTDANGEFILGSIPSSANAVTCCQYDSAGTATVYIFVYRGKNGSNQHFFKVYDLSGNAVTSASIGVSFTYTMYPV